MQTVWQEEQRCFLLLLVEDCISYLLYDSASSQLFTDSVHPPSSATVITSVWRSGFALPLQESSLNCQNCIATKQVPPDLQVHL